MRLYVTSVFVDDQAKALEFYTTKLGFEKKTDVPVGEYRWLTVVSPEQRDGVELLLEPSNHPAVKPYREALVNDGIALASFEVDDIEAECQRLKSLDVNITMEPVSVGEVTIAMLDDTCGNLVQLIQRNPS